MLIHLHGVKIYVHLIIPILGRMSECIRFNLTLNGL